MNIYNRIFVYTKIAMTIFILFGCRYENVISQENKLIQEDTPSKSIYFDWININWHGGNENKVLSNLGFFKWMNEEYGMQLDIYLMDAGNIDNGPDCNGCEEMLKNAPTYGGINSEWFKQKYPNGLDSIYELAKSFNCNLGVWLGPDGYGISGTEAQERLNMYQELIENYEVKLIKLDRCCSDLDPKNEEYFKLAMKRGYEYTPDLIVLNHRITLSDEAEKYATTFLWEGAETYIEVSGNNSFTSPHHRYTLQRGLPPDLKRLTEDHGVCLSSYLDFWEDDLVLQAFNRNLILSPEIYGNPWFLKDDEFPLLARIFNLHREYKDILVNGIILNENQFGPSAVARGDENTRFITLRNLSWNSVSYTLPLDQSIGLQKDQKVHVYQYHPFEEILGTYSYGDQVKVDVLPFRSSLIKVSNRQDQDVIEGAPFHTIKNIPGVPFELDVMGLPGDIKSVRWIQGNRKFKEAYMDGELIEGFLSDKTIKVKFEGDESQENDFHRKLGELTEIAVPEDIQMLFDGIYFGADNNCLEVRSLQRSGKSDIPAVNEARSAFFNDEIFIGQGSWDRFAFDNDINTYFKVRNYCFETSNSVHPGILRVELPQEVEFDNLILAGVEKDYVCNEAWFSSDLSEWFPLDPFTDKGQMVLNKKNSKSVKYIKVDPAPWQVSEIQVIHNGLKLDMNESKASNLFPSADLHAVSKAWSSNFVIGDIYPTSYLAVAIDGNYGADGAFAVIKTSKGLIGAHDRSPAYIANHWEHHLAPQKGNYTYYFKIPPWLKDVEFEVIVLGTKNVEKIETPKVWLTSYPLPFVKKRLVLN
jgi:hypothetical protein